MKRFSIIIAILFFSLAALAQQQVKRLPIDPKVKIGTLPNGLTYYIRHNEQPKQRAEFFIAQKVGSILENDSQLGLAHFLEHMAFNGSKNFPGNNLIKYMETIGVKFGENLNAYTSFDETVYNISNVPTTRSSIVDSALLVLHDWSSFISLEGSEIDKERGVIREEWRTGNTGNSRVMNAYLKEVYPNNITGNRVPIGSIDVINSFSHQQLRDYYKKWYRPDLQAIIIIGDIDVADIEDRIKNMFADISKPTNPTQRNYVGVEDNKEPIVSIATDPEVVNTSVSLMYKKDIIPFTNRNTDVCYVNSIEQILIAQMINARFAEISSKANPPFLGAESNYGNFMQSITKGSWSTSASTENGKVLNSLKAIVRENERMHRFGFCASELDRAKAELIRLYENVYNERDKIENEALAREYIRNFITNEPIPGIEFEYDLMRNMLPSLTVEKVNKLAKSYVSDTNMVIIVSGPKTESIFTPTKKDVLSVIDEVKNEKLEPYEDKVITKPLLGCLPKAGKIVKIEQAPFGYTKWTLSNGTKVYLKKTDFKKDQILMYGFSEGGNSLFDVKDRPNYTIMNEVVPLGGIGEFDPLEISKLLSGKIVDVSTSIEDNSESLSGYASPKDVETLMQLTYLKFTQPRKDEVAFKNFLLSTKDQMENMELDPTVALSDSIRMTVYNHNPLVSRFDLNMLEKVDYHRVMELYRERFANASDFSFILTGNLDEKVIQPFVEIYLGGLPSKNKTEEWKDLGIRMVKGTKVVDFERELGVPKTTVFINYSGKAKYTLENDVLMDFVSSILDFRYTEAIREKEGGSYGISVSGSIGNKPVEQYALQVSFDTDPKLKAKLVSIVHDEIKKLIENGPTIEDVNKVKEFKLRKNQEMQIENGYWQSVLSQYLINNIDYSSYVKTVQNVTPEMVKNAAKEWLTQGNIVEVIMGPKSKK